MTDIRDLIKTQVIYLEEFFEPCLIQVATQYFLNRNFIAKVF